MYCGIQINSSLYSRYYVEACHQWLNPSQRPCAWTVQLRRNVAAVTNWESNQCLPAPKAMCFSTASTCRSFTTVNVLNLTILCLLLPTLVSFSVHLYDLIFKCHAVTDCYCYCLLKDCGTKGGGTGEGGWKEGPCPPTFFEGAMRGP